MILTRPMPSRDARNRRWGRRCSAIVAVVTLCSALLAAGALARKPETVKVPPFGSFMNPPGEACPEAIAPKGVRATWFDGNRVQKTFDNGKVIITGRFSERFRNVATGKAVVLDLHGRIASVPRPNGSLKSRFRGAHAFNFLPGDVGPGDDATGRTYLFTGNLKVVIGANGVVNTFHSAGKKEDVCAMIA